MKKVFFNNRHELIYQDDTCELSYEIEQGMNDVCIYQISKKIISGKPNLNDKEILNEIVAQLKSKGIVTVID